jgi:hypothetical protein
LRRRLIEPDTKSGIMRPYGRWVRTLIPEFESLRIIDVTISHHSRKTFVWLLAGVLLFGQAVGISQACSTPSATPAMAFSDDMAGMDCANKVNPNACLQQCTAGDQSSSHVQIAVAEMPRLVVLTVATAFQSTASLSESVLSLAHSSGPPPSIRFCSFQL